MSSEHKCGMYNGEWVEYKKEQQRMSQMIANTHELVETQAIHLQHLSKLETISTTLVDMKDSMLDAVLSRQHVPLDVVKEMISQVHQGNNASTTSSDKRTDLLIRVLAWGIILLLFVIAFLLVGENLKLIRKLF